MKQESISPFPFKHVIALHDAWWERQLPGPVFMCQYPRDPDISFKDLARPWMRPHHTEKWSLWGQESLWSLAFATWRKTRDESVLMEAMAVLDRYFENAAYADLGFPYARPDLAAVGLSGIISGSCHHTGESMWYDQDPGWELDRIRTACGDALAGDYWRDIQTSAQLLFDRFSGRVLFSSMEFGEPMDVLSSLRGAGNLMLDLLECPEEVDQTLAAINTVRWQAFENLSARATAANRGIGYTETMRFASSKPVWCSACDTAALFSPAMVERFVVPTILEEAARFRLAWHLDGPDMPRHLDVLQSIPAIQCIQWVPGAGKPGWCDPAWDDLYRRIHSTGRRIGMLVANESEVPALAALLKRHPPEAFYIWCFPSSREIAAAFMSAAGRDFNAHE